MCHDGSAVRMVVITEEKGLESDKSQRQKRKTYFKWNDVTSNLRRGIIDVIHWVTEWYKWWWYVKSTPDMQRNFEGNECCGKGKMIWGCVECIDGRVGSWIWIWSVGLM